MIYYCSLGFRVNMGHGMVQCISWKEIFFLFNSKYINRKCILFVLERKEDNLTQGRMQKRNGLGMELIV